MPPAGATTPDAVRPMLATAGPLPPDDDAWAYEVKWDGMRILAHAEDGALRLRTRTGRDVTASYPELGGLPAELPVDQALIDGEIVAFDADGRPSFGALQPRMAAHDAPGGRTRGARRAGSEGAPARVALMAFDLLWRDGEPLLDRPWDERRAALEALGAGAAWSVPLARRREGAALLNATAETGLEGVVAKRRDAPYRPGRRSPAWVKARHAARGTFLIGGHLPGTGARARTFGSLQLGQHDADGALRLVGGVGTGFTDEVLADLTARLGELRADASPFVGAQPPRGTVPVLPRLRCEVRYASLTDDGRLRHASFLGIVDRPEAGEDDVAAAVAPPVVGASAGAPEGDAPSLRAAVVTRARATPPACAPVAPPSAAVRIPRAGDHHLDVEGRTVRLTNLDRVLWPQTGHTKADLLDHLVAVAPVLLPHVDDRAITLVRHPNGVAAPGFYAKRAVHRPDWLATTVVPSGSERGPVEHAVLRDLPSLLWAGNLAGIELHPALHPTDRPEHPRTVVFDLDPGEGATILACCEVALEVRALLTGLGLRAHPKTSGSKGLQLHVPVHPQTTYARSTPFAHAVAALLERRRPDLVVSRMAKRLRAGRVLVDWSQNVAAKTTVAVYSPRARERPTVSTPVTWAEVEAALAADDPDRLVFDLAAVGDRVARDGDRYADVLHDGPPLPELRP